MCVHAHTCAHTCHNANVEIRGQHSGVSSLLPMWNPETEVVKHSASTSLAKPPGWFPKNKVKNQNHWS